MADWMKMFERKLNNLDATDSLILGQREVDHCFVCRGTFNSDSVRARREQRTGIRVVQDGVYAIDAGGEGSDATRHPISQCIDARLIRRGAYKGNSTRTTECRRVKVTSSAKRSNTVSAVAIWPLHSNTLDPCAEAVRLSRTLLDCASGGVTVMRRICPGTSALSLRSRPMDIVRSRFPSGRPMNERS